MHKVYVKHKRISCSDLSPITNISHCIYANIPKSGKKNLKHLLDIKWGALSLPLIFSCSHTTSKHMPYFRIFVELITLYVTLF